MGTWLIRTGPMENTTGGFSLVPPTLVPDGAAALSAGTVDVPILLAPNLYLDGSATPITFADALLIPGFTLDDVWNVHSVTFCQDVTDIAHYTVPASFIAFDLAGPIGAAPPFTTDTPQTGMDNALMTFLFVGRKFLVTADVTSQVSVQNLTGNDGTWDDVFNISLTGTYHLEVIVGEWWQQRDATGTHFRFSVSSPGQNWAQVGTNPRPSLRRFFVPSTYQDGVTTSVTIEDLSLDSDGTLVAELASDALLVDPAFGCAGTPVILAGSGFGENATVLFDAVEATSVTVINANVIWCIAPPHADGTVDVTVTNADTEFETAENSYTYGEPWWTQTLTFVVDGDPIVFSVLVQGCLPPDDGTWVLNTPIAPTSALSPPPFFPATPPTPFVPPFITCTNGWYTSPEAFGGSIVVLCGQVPNNPRTWSNISVWAAGTRGMLGGSPAGSCNVNNRMVYPATGYTVGTDAPPLRVFNGSFDHELCRVPPTTAGNAPYAVLSMLTAGGTMYLTTHDSGTSYANWSGRVFALNLDAGITTPIGLTFPTGEMPYALAWHMNRLWCGTNNGVGTGGKVYYFRPGIDTTWAMDHDCGAGVNVLRSYHGQLYVGVDSELGARGLVLVRDTTGVYTTSDTGTGGAIDFTDTLASGLTSRLLYAAFVTAGAWPIDDTDSFYLPTFDDYTIINGLTTPRTYAALLTTDAAWSDAFAPTVTLDQSAALNNGYLAMAVFNDTLYATYWNQTSPAISKIRQYDGTTWSTVYTGTANTIRPFIVLLEDDAHLFAIAGGLNLTGAIVRSDDGTTWTDLTPNLPEASRTLLPIVGVEVL